MADLATRRNALPGKLLLVLLVGLPAFSYPLSWFSKSWVHFRYDWTLRIPEIVLAAALFGFIFRLVRKQSPIETEVGEVSVSLPSAVVLPMLAVILSAVASTRFSEYPQFALALLVRLAGNLAIFLLAVQVPKDRRGQLSTWWIMTAAIVAVNGLLRLGSEAEFLSTFGNWDFLGTYLAASLIIVVSRGGWKSIWSILIILAAMVFCRSRGAWLALGAVGLLGFLVLGDRILKRATTRVVVVVVILVGASFLVRSYIQRQWQAEVRPVIWKATLKMIAAQPLLGHGLGTYVAVYPKFRLPEYFLRLKATNVTDHAHNELLEVAAEQGLIGLGVTLWFWATAIACGIRACRELSTTDGYFLWGVFAAMLLFMLHSLLDVDLRYLPNQSFLWLLMGLLVGSDATPSRWRRIMIQPLLIRWCLAGVCLVLGIWITVSTIIRPMVADTEDRRARIAEERGDMLVAAQHAREALLFDPFRLSTRYLLAGALARLPDLTARAMAIEQCRRIEELAPDYADVTYNLGQLYLMDGHPTEAIAYLRRAVEINPYDGARKSILASALHDTTQNNSVPPRENQPASSR